MPVVVTSEAEARAALVDPVLVVLIVAADDVAGALEALGGGAGRLAVFVGDPHDPAHREAAAAMAAELGPRG